MCGQLYWPIPEADASKKVKTRCLVTIICCFFATAVFAQAPNPAEVAAFNAALRAFHGSAFDFAQRELADFVRKFPQSAKVPEAILLQAQAALKLGNGKPAAALLATNLATAGVFTEQYLYWLGKVCLQTSNYLAAANSFGRVVKDFADSPRVLESSYYQAFAHFQMKEWTRVIDLLSRPGQPFQKIAMTRPDDEIINRGFLLLAESLLENSQVADSEKVLNGLRLANLAPQLKWDHEFLLCRVQLASRRFAAALAGSSNLVALAESAGAPALRAESISLQAGILQQLNDLPAAAAAYEQNLRKEVPAAHRRQSLLKIIEITLAQNALDDAVVKLERLLADHPSESGSDVARLTLGELRLKQYLGATNSSSVSTNAAAYITNSIKAALLQFDALLKASPSGPLAGKAHLNRGWCLWLSGKTNDSAASFKLAIDLLPRSEDQAVARFKLGDVLLERRDYSNALDNFRAVLTNYTDLPLVRESIAPQAWHHVLRCSIELNDLAQASEAMNQLLLSFPHSPFADKSLLLLGQELGEGRQPAEARKLFSQFARRFSESTLLPEVHLALARTYELENKWDVAVDRYDQWALRYSTNDLKPRAEFSRAIANYKAGRETNALLLFTNFLAQFPTNQLAPLARYWVGDFYYRQGDFVQAEYNYQLLSENTNWIGSPLVYQARMMAGRAAFAREGYKFAAEHFRALINDNNCPTNLAAEAFFALGDSMIKQEPEPGKTALHKFDEAKVAFKKILDLYPGSEQVPRALGKIGDCYYQMAFFDAKFYENALEEYQKVINHPKADINARSLAEIGLGAVFEAQAKLPAAADPEPLIKAAFEHYYNVVSGKNLNGEKADLFCFKQASVAAARIAEDRRQWEIVLDIYSNLVNAFPSMKPALDRKIQRAASEQLRNGNDKS